MINLIATHNGSFHADDVFSIATLKMIYPDVKVIRTRDKKELEKVDLRVDIGGKDSHETKDYDHHQKGGAGERGGIPYASFGLIWKSYGMQLVSSQEEWQKIEDSIVKSIDADDNGVSLFEVKGEISPITISEMIGRLNPLDSHESDNEFFKAVDFAQNLLKTILAKAKFKIESAKKVREILKNKGDKKYIVFEEKLAVKDIVRDESDLLYTIHENQENGNWQVIAVGKEKGSFENRKSLPESWRGLTDQDLAKVTGVSDAVFCHNAGFIAVAKSKEGAIKLAELAIENE
jgi:uncharacterized UPF0160 family protein